LTPGEFIARLRTALQAPPTDWNGIYLAINSSGFADPRFHADRFGRQPCRHIIRVLEEVHRRDRERANAVSITTARLAQIVQCAASMGKASTKLQEFLPYPLEVYDERPRLSAEVAATLRELINQRAMPMAIMAFLMEDIGRADVLD
jgi:hypothetical protein